MCQRVPSMVHTAWMESLTCTIGDTNDTERIKKEFNKRIFSYNWFIENDCHLQLKCPIKIDVIVMISSRLSRPDRSDLTQVVYTDQNYYIDK